MRLPHHLRKLTPGPRLRAFGARLLSLKSLWAVLYVTVLPTLLTRDLLLDVWRSGRPRAWDGTGHYGIAQIYAQSIFPDTFGWTHAHFGGMPFPNFYPPLFFWCVALVERTHLVSLLTTFKAFVLLPLLLIPAALWLLAWVISGRDRRVAFWAAMTSVYPLVSARFGGQMQWSSGLDYFSTISIGMYTQPLGFVLLLAWFSVYVEAQRRARLFVLACVLLALAVLANFLNGIMATIVVAAVLIFDLLRARPGRAGGRPAGSFRTLAAHTMAPVVSLGLALFWLVPMLGSYGYFVTRPFTLVIVTTDMLWWFAFAAAGCVCWLRRPTRDAAPYVTACALLAAVIFTAAAAPRWLPLQANRLMPTLYFLLSVPVAYSLTTGWDVATGQLYRWLPRVRPYVVRLAPFALCALLLLMMYRYYASARIPAVEFYYGYQARLANYPAVVDAAPPPPRAADPAREEKWNDALADSSAADVKQRDIANAFGNDHLRDEEISAAAAASIEGVLDFARGRREGRYLVEIPAQYSVEAASFDARALNSYLGAQGNQTLNVVYREASPNSIFTYPQVGALSHNPDNFGFSSVLGDDLDFVEQPLEKHLMRARYLGVRYLVMHTPAKKERLAGDPGISARYDFGSWSVFELREAPPPPVRALAFRPALLVSDFTLKGRRANEYNYVRFAEEQFADGWFDVLLARAPSVNLDELGTTRELSQFGALIIDQYQCERCDLVYRQLKTFAQNRPLILLSDDSSLFNRVRGSIADFPKATIIERDPDASPGAWLDNRGATRRYTSSPPRLIWARIRAILESNKIPVEDAAAVSGEIKGNTIELSYDPAAPTPALGAPVLVSTSYHPNWRPEPGQVIYAANPMYMLTFARRSTRLTFARTPLDVAGAWSSAFVLLALFGFTLLSAALPLLKRRRRDTTARAPVAAHGPNGREPVDPFVVSDPAGLEALKAQRAYEERADDLERERNLK